MGKLTAIEAKAFTKPGRYTDGDGLHLHVRPTGKKTWVLRFMRHGKLRDMGLGAFPAVTLGKAREKAAAARVHISEGGDPIEIARKTKVQEAQPDRTFKVAAERLIKEQKAGWRNAKHGAQWTSTLTTYAYPVFGDSPVQAVDTEAVLRVLRPIWSTKPETASRVRGRIEAVLDAAKAMHWREGENPARWKGHLASLLPPARKVRQVEHHPSLPWRRLPAFLAALRGRPGSSARAIEFAILTCARSGEVRGLIRRELDLEGKTWTVPRERMKGGRPHRVPLSAAALALLAELDVEHMAPGTLLFPGIKGTNLLSAMSLTMTLRRLNEVEDGQPVPWVDGATGEPITVHGFRSTFRVWAGEETSYPREVIEQALSHAVAGAVEAAYARTDLLEKRRALMEDWGGCLSTGAPLNEPLSIRAQPWNSSSRGR